MERSPPRKGAGGGTASLTPQGVWWAAGPHSCNLCFAVSIGWPRGLGSQSLGTGPPGRIMVLPLLYQHLSPQQIKSPKRSSSQRSPSPSTAQKKSWLEAHSAGKARGFLVGRERGISYIAFPQPPPQGSSWEPCTPTHQVKALPCLGPLAKELFCPQPPLCPAYHPALPNMAFLFSHTFLLQMSHPILPTG